jgi:small-conductance mechanosensitive channel
VSPFIHRPARLSAGAPAARAARQLTLQTVQRAKRARRHLIVTIPLTILVILAYRYRRDLFGVDLPVRVAAAILVVVLGWQLARDVGRLLQPWLFRRMDHATAGTIGFLIRLTFLVIATAAALRLAGLNPRTLAVGGAITAVIFGLAAQQTLGHLIAGLVLISARPFRVGDRVRLHAGGLAGQVEGRVSSLGLLYTTLSQGEDMILVPNSVVLSAAAVPLREPAGVDLRARLRPDVRPSQVQELLQRTIRTPVRSEPHIGLEEVDSDEVIVRIAATPEFETDGPKLADEILEAIAGVTRDLDDGTGEWRTVPRSRAERDRRKDEELQAAGDRAGRFGDGDGPGDGI